MKIAWFISVMMMGMMCQATTYYWDINGTLSGAGGSGSPDGFWDGAMANWNTNSSGAGSGSLFSTTTIGDDVVLCASTDATGSYTVMLAGSQSARTVTFKDGSPTLSGASLNLASNATITVSNGVTAIAGSSIAGAATNLTKSGAGTLVLIATNIYTGGTTVNAGTMTVSGGMVTNTGVVTVGNTAGVVATLALVDGGQVFSTANSIVGSASKANSNVVSLGSSTGANSVWDLGAMLLTIGNSATATGNWMTVSGGGVVTNGRVKFLGFGGSLTITNGGQVFTTIASTIGGYSGAICSNVVSIGSTTGANSVWNLGATSLNIGDAGNVGNGMTVSAGGVVTNGGAIVVGYNTTSVGNALVITNGGQVFSGSATIGYGAGCNSNVVSIGSTTGTNSVWDVGAATLYLGNNAAATGNWMTVSGGGVLTNGATVLLGGVGAGLTLAGDAYVNKVSLGVPDAVLNFNGGTLHARTAGGLIYGSGTGMVQAAGASLDSAGFAVTVGVPLTGAGGLVKLGNGTLTLTNVNTYTGITTVNNGKLVLLNALAASGTTVSNWVSGGLVFGNGITAFTLGGLAGSSDLALTNAGGTAVTVAVGNNNSSTVYSGSMSGPGSVIKTGSGALVINGVNTYVGDTVVSNGTLAGTGTLAGSVVVTSGGTLAPGVSSVNNGMGTLRVSNLVMDEGSAYCWDASSTGSDMVVVGGKVTLPAIMTVRVSMYDRPIKGHMPLFTFVTSDGASDLSNWTIQNGPSGARVWKDGNQVVLDYQIGTVIRVQ